LSRVGDIVSIVVITHTLPYNGKEHRTWQ